MTGLTASAPQYGYSHSMAPDETTHNPPAGPDYSSDGVDVTLIRWMLSLSPLERLEVLQASAGSLERLREGARTDS